MENIESNFGVPKVAILLPTHNGALFLRDQVISIVNQESIDVTIIVSDDMSTDSTLSIIYSLIDLGFPIQLLSQRGTGFGNAAKNYYHLMVNVKLDDFDYIALCDQDDVWFKDKIIFAIRQIDVLKCDAFSSDVIAQWPITKKKRLIIKSGIQKKFDYLFEPPGPGCTHVYAVDGFRLFLNYLRKNYTKLQNCDCHDWLIYAFYRANGLKWCISSVPKMYYTQHENNEVGANVNLKTLCTRLEKVKNGWYRDQCVFMRSKFGPVGKNFNHIRFILKYRNDFRRKKFESLCIAILLLLKLA